MEHKNLEDVYFDIPKAKQRYSEVIRTFSEHFQGQTPEFIARSPGRVNIIGDHIDYSDFPCLPAAIEFDVILAVRTVTDSADPGFGKVQLVNTNSEFEPFEFAADPHTKIEDRSWANYFKCAWITGLKHLGAKEAKGLKIVVSGNVPVGGGLSSSAAFVVSGIMAVIKAHTTEFPLDKYELAKLSATCEQLVGVNSGGLDQSASVFGKKDHALLVSFQPKLQVEPLRFSSKHEPPVFLIANSLSVSAKLDSAPIHYNLRVVEVTVAAQILAKQLELTIPNNGNLNAGTLYGVFDAKYGSKQISPACLSEIITDVNKHLKKEPYTIEEAAEALLITVDEFKQKFLTAFPVKFDTLKLNQRATHVYEETLRVLMFVNAMKAGAHPQILGELMNESQQSAEGLYENSHRACEDMCSIARRAGALGSRITGAGWGGCTVHLVERSRAQAVRDALQNDYYDKHHPNAPSDALVETRPSGGSAFFSDVQVLL